MIMELFDLFENVKNDVFDYFGDAFGDKWESQEIVGRSIDETCDFFHIPEPAVIRLDSDVTAVETQNIGLIDDDVLLFSKDQLKEMGINNKGSIDLVMTHEFTHRMLQGINSHMDSWDEELCCDFMAGVRAGLNHIETIELNNALGNSQESLTHPGGELRIHAVEQGVHFAKNYLTSHNGTPPSFNDCLEYYQKSEAYSNEMPQEVSSVNLRIENEVYSNVQSNQTETSDDNLKQFSHQEIHNHKYEAELEKARSESDIRHLEYMIKSKIRMGEAHSALDSSLHDAKDRLQHAKDDLNKWRNEKPDD